MNFNQNPSSASYYSEPHIQFLSQLLAEIARGAAHPKIPETFRLAAATTTRFTE